MLALQAVALGSQGEGVQAAAALQSALSLAAPEGYVRTFLDEGAPMAALLRAAAARGAAVEYVRKLLAAFGDEETTVAQRSPQGAASALVEPLSERELEVLRLIAVGLSNQEIAEQLITALSTVKKHINHIYGKLAVRSRTQAVARARELGLL